MLQVAFLADYPEHVPTEEVKYDGVDVLVMEKSM